MTTSLPSDTKMPVINPHMKFPVTKVGVVESPEVYQYSLQRDLQRADDYYNNFLRSVEKKNKAKLTEKYPNLTHNIIGILKTITILFAAYCGLRYRHSIPVVKSICGKPEKTPPSFTEDFKRIFNIKTK